MPKANTYNDKMNYRNRLSLKDRIAVIKSYEKVKSCRKLAEDYNCSVYQIRNIIRDRKDIWQEYLTTKPGFDQRITTLFEKVLLEWFRRAQRCVETGPITNDILLQKADEAKRVLSMDNYETDRAWLMKFRLKYDISDLEMSMLMIENNAKRLSVDMYDIGVDVMEQCSKEEHIVQQPVESQPEPSSSPIVLSPSPEPEFDDCSATETICQKLELPDDYCKSNDGSRNNDEGYIPGNADVVELVIPPIANDEQARRHLKPLEDYALMKENFRAIGLITQLEEIFNSLED